MGATASLSTARLEVVPGEEISFQVTVRNTGSVVDEFAVSVVGDAAAFATVEPPDIRLFPGAEQLVTVRFHPPRAANVPAGSMPFAVRVQPREDAEGGTAEEGTLEIGAFHDLSAELLPRTARGRRRTRHELAIDNRGNTRVNALLTAADADELLDFTVEPAGLVIQPGHASFAKVGVSRRKRFWRGPPKTLPFQVFVEPEGDVPLAVDGTMLQEPMIPKWFLKALILALLLIILLVVLWFTLLRPTLDAAARQAAEEELAEIREEQAEIAEQAAAAEEKAEAAGAAAAAAEDAAAGAAEEAAVAAEEAAEAVETAALSSGQPVGLDLGDPFDFRLARSVVPGGQGPVSRVVPGEELYSITDIVLQNPQGDRGLMQIRRISGGSVQTLLEVRLENFRDLDYHFVSPVRFAAGEEVTLFVSCDNNVEGGSGQPCNAAAYFSGFVKDLTEDSALETTSDDG